MQDSWKSTLKADPTAWLLKAEDPSLRFFVARDLLDLPPADLAPYRHAVSTSPPIEHILALQQPGGYWFTAEDFYEHSKYKGSVWSVILLAELGADPADERVRRAGEFLLAYSQVPGVGGFSYYGSEQGGALNGIIPCLTGNLTWALLTLGFTGDPRLDQAVNWIAAWQRFDDREGPAPKGDMYIHWLNCWGRHTCAMGAIKALKALSLVPPAGQSPAVQGCIEQGVEFFLKHRVYRRSHNLEKIIDPRWVSLSFPHFYDTDALEILSVLLDLGCRDERLLPAVELVLEKQGEDGRWHMERSWNGRMLVRVDRVGEPSPWITYKAMHALKRWNT